MGVGISVACPSPGMRQLSLGRQVVGSRAQEQCCRRSQHLCRDPDEDCLSGEMMQESGASCPLFFLENSREDGSAVTCVPGTGPFCVYLPPLALFQSLLQLDASV